MKTEKSYSADFVLDCSVAMSWCFEDETSKHSEAIFDKFNLNDTQAFVPIIWSLEVANVLLMAEKNKRLTTIKAIAFIEALNALPIKIDEEGSKKIFGSTSELARETNLTIYDACYLELAMRLSLPLATLDKDLIKAANKMNIPVYQP